MLTTDDEYLTVAEELVRLAMHGFAVGGLDCGWSGRSRAAEVVEAEVLRSHVVDADDRIIAAAETRRELEMHLLGIHLVHLDRNNFLQLLEVSSS